MNWGELRILVRVADGKASDLNSVPGRVSEFLIFIFTARSEVCGQGMFLHLSVILFTRGGGIGDLCPGLGSLSSGGVSVQWWGLCPGRGFLSRGCLCLGCLCPGDLCPGMGFSVQ